MDVDRRKEQLRVALYHWSLAEWDTQLSAGMKQLGTLRSTGVQMIVARMALLDPDNQRSLARALVKRFHPKAVDLTGDVLTQEETEYLRAWDRWRGQHALTYAVMNEGFTSSARRESAKILKGALTFLGAPKAFGSSAEWRYSSNCGTWQVITHLDIGGRFGEVAYHHEVSMAGERSFLGLVSLLSLLGVSSETRWPLGNAQDAHVAGAQIAQVVTPFLGLMEGLS